MWDGGSLVLQLDYKEPSLSKESYFATVVGSAVRHLLSLLADRCYPVYQVRGTIDSLHGFQQYLAMLFLLQPLFHPS